MKKLLTKIKKLSTKHKLWIVFGLPLRLIMIPIFFFIFFCSILYDIKNVGLSKALKFDRSDITDIVIWLTIWIVFGIPVTYGVRLF